MLFLHRLAEGPRARAWWDAVAEAPSDAPGPVRQLTRRNAKSIVGSRVEFDQAIAWAQTHPAWNDDDPPLLIHDSVRLPARPARTQPMF